ncbi:MAG: NAD-dependent epimerase/dehydratase family protein [Clostridiales bacterium]
MKILITGGYGFIGSYIGHRYIKEGAKISIIDDLSSSNKEPPDFSHKFFKLDVSDRKCEEVFKSEKFEIVIHLATHKNLDSALINPYVDAQTNILGLVNMLELSHKYNVKKFLYLSDAFVYGELTKSSFNESDLLNPSSLISLNKYIGEHLLYKWNEVHNIPFICFRLSNVYGPKGHGIINTFIENVINGDDLIVYGNGSQTRDFIFVEDVAEAVFYMSKGNFQGIYNLSTNSETSINDVIKNIKKINKIGKILKNDFEKYEIKRSRLDNSKILDETNWAPIYDLQSGLNKTFSWYIGKSSENKFATINKNSTNIKNLLYKHLPKVYVFSGFIGLILISLILNISQSSQLVVLGIFYITFSGLLYGIKSSLVASVLSFFTYLNMIAIGGKDISTLLLNSQTILTLFIYTMIGYTSGYVNFKYEKLLSERESSIKTLENKYNILNDIFVDTLNIKEKYQEQILSSDDSFNKIFSIVMELENLDPDLIYNSSISVIENVLKCEYVIIHGISENRKFARIVAHSKKADIEGKRSIKIADNFEFKFILKSNEIYINVDLKEGVPSIIGSVVDRKKIIAVISLFNIEFEKMNNNFINLFKMVVKLISHSLSRANRFDDIMKDDYYIKDTVVLTKKRFKSVLESKIEIYNKFETPYTLIKINISENDFYVTTHFIINQIRETDYIGMGEENNIYILLSNTKKVDSEVLIERLKRNKINLNILNSKESEKCLVLL